MKRQHLIIIAVVAVVLLLVGGGVLAYAISQGGTLPGLSQPTPTADKWGALPPVKMTPPASLDDIAQKIEADYPQLAELLRDPKLGSVYKDFYLVYKEGGQEAAIALAKQRAILNDKNEIEMTLVLDTEDTTALIKELEAEKVIVKGSYRNKINIAIPLALIEEQVKAKDPDLIVKRISSLNHVIRLEVTQKAGPQGIIRGQGVNVTYAANWHEQGITGKGVKVGVLDLGFAGYEKLLGSELPENVTVQVFGEDYDFKNEPHGTACAEIVHEMAPDAEIFLAYYDGSDVTLGQAIEWLMSQEVDIISNSTGSNGLSPLDGSGFAAGLADMAHDQGIFFVSAAGNEADVHWRGQFNDTDGNNMHEFFPGKETLPFIPGGPGFTTKIIMNWNDWQAIDQDYNLLLADEEGNLLATSGDMQNGESGQLPLEAFINEFENDNVHLLAIENVDGKARGDAIIDIFIMDGAMHPDYQVPGYSLTNPADARGAFTVGAVNWSNDVLEPYSSQGPTEDGRLKPDLSAPSVVDSASYKPEAFNGTSAATPHVAGAAALVLQAFPDFKPDDIAKFLQERSLDLGDTGPDNVFGVGRLSLGAAPDKAEQPEATPPPPPDVQLEPTSTPVPVAENQPKPGGETGIGGQPGGDTGIGGQPGGQSGAPGQTEESGLVGTLVLLGLCMTCLAGLLFILIIVGFLMTRRRK